MTIDIGNSVGKAALFRSGNIVEYFRIGEEVLPEVDRAIVASTRGAVELDIRAREVMWLGPETRVPIVNRYATPATLGVDRLAAAVGAADIFPGEGVLVVDFGTAITYDVVTAAGEFLGGNIAPGVELRFRALSEFTKALPMGQLPEGEMVFPARCTRDAVESGVAMGIAAETEKYVERARRDYGIKKIIFTGGDAEFFAERLNFTIFATSDLVFRGLNRILEYNA